MALGFDSGACSIGRVQDLLGMFATAGLGNDPINDAFFIYDKGGPKYSHVMIAKVTGLHRTSSSQVFGVTVQDQFLSFKRRKGNFIPILIDTTEQRGFITGL